MSNLEKWIRAILNEDADNLSIGSVRTLQMIKHEFEAREREIKRLEESVIEKENFAIMFASWAMYHPDAQALIASGITAYGLLEKYKDRPYIDANPQNQ